MYVFCLAATFVFYVLVKKLTKKDHLLENLSRRWSLSVPFYSADFLLTTYHPLSSPDILVGFVVNLLSNRLYARLSPA